MVNGDRSATEVMGIKIALRSSRYANVLSSLDAYCKKEPYILPKENKNVKIASKTVGEVLLVLARASYLKIKSADWKYKLILPELCRCNALKFVWG